jgi:predicted helicase
MTSPGNIAISVPRSVEIGRGWEHVWCSDMMIQHHTVSLKEVNYLFPLWLLPDGTESRTLPNIALAIAERIESLTGLLWDTRLEARGEAEVLKQRRERRDLEKIFGPRDVFDWIYAVLHSPTYRSRYAGYLKSDFARIPLPGSKELFQELVPLGTKLVSLHLLDIDGTADLKDPKSVRFAGNDEARVEKKPEWSAAGGNRVTISSHRWFEGVPERVWDFHIGGYRPAEKWLKDRAKKAGKKARPGRVLTAEDQLHYRRMIVAMDKTIDIMAEIDCVIDKHGGWPEAFAGAS